MAIFWEEASPSVLSTARELIDQFHHDLQEANIVFLFRSEPAMVAGKIAHAKTSKVSPQMKALLDDADFIIWVSKPIWEGQGEKTRMAIMDHELSHCGIEDGVPYLKPHDVEEFKAVIDRHGLWNYDLLKMGEAIKKHQQFALPGVDTVSITHKGRTETISAEKLSLLSNMEVDR